MGTKTATSVHSNVHRKLTFLASIETKPSSHWFIWHINTHKCTKSGFKDREHVCSRNTQLGLVLHGGNAKRPAECVLLRQWMCCKQGTVLQFASSASHLLWKGNCELINQLCKLPFGGHHSDNVPEKLSFRTYPCFLQGRTFFACIRGKAMILG